jgi:hypothetical protein
MSARPRRPRVQRKERRSPPRYPIFDVEMHRSAGSAPKMRGMNGKEINSEEDFQAYAMEYVKYLDEKKKEQAAAQGGGGGGGGGAQQGGGGGGAQ